MAADFPEALIEAAAADGTLAGAGLGTWHYGVDTEPGYPYLVVTDIGGRKPRRNFGKGQIHEKHYRINIFSISNTEAAALGKLARAFLERIQANPLTFDEGRQMDFHQSGDEDLVLSNRRRPGPGAQPFVWLCSSPWVLEYSRDRTS